MADVKDLEKAGRLNEAFNHIYGSDGITSRSQWADRLQVQRTALSAAMNGNPAYLTKNLFIKVCAAHPNTFNLDYFLTGQGTLLNAQQAQPPSIIDGASSLIDLAARLIQETEAIRQQLSQELSEVSQLRHDLTDALHIIKGSYYPPTTHFDLPTAAETSTQSQQNSNVSPQLT